MSDTEDFLMSDGGNDTDDYLPQPKKSAATKKTPAASKPKATAAKKTAASSSKAAPAKKAPLVKRKSNEGVEEDDSFASGSGSGAQAADASMSIIDAVEGPTAAKAASKASGSNTNKSASETYQKLSQLEHVLKRPDTYIGSVEQHTEKLWVYDPVAQHMAYREIQYVPGFYKVRSSESS